MAILINHEAKKNLRSPIDFERFGERFKTSNDYFSFPSPDLETLDKNLFYLLRNSQEVSFETRYRFRPDYVSFDYYGVTTLSNLIMYVNGIFSVEDFDKLDKLVIPSMHAITTVLKDSYSIPDVEDLEAIEW